MSIAGSPRTSGAPDGYAQVHASEEFTALRQTFRRTIFPATAAFLLWYFAYVLLAAFAPAFMATRVIGNINVGLLMGLGQFVTTFAITMGYRRWADRQLDPGADRLRAHLEDGAAR